jgi:hypothetical protein
VSNVIKAPWTPEQVDGLNRYQSLRGFYHPYTCGSGRRTDAQHTDGEGVLKATPDGWVCPYCNYKQNWANAGMVVTEEQAESIAKLLICPHSYS